MKTLKIIACVLGFIVLGIGSGFAGFWFAQGNHEEIQDTQPSVEVAQEKEVEQTQETQEVDPWANWQQPTTVKFEGEDILINNGQSIPTQLKWMVVDENGTLLEVGGQVTSMIQWTVQFEDGEFGHLVWDQNPAGAGNTGWTLTKGVN